VMLSMQYVSFSEIPIGGRGVLPVLLVNLLGSPLTIARFPVFQQQTERGHLDWDSNQLTDGLIQLVKVHGLG
jgi:hypothetical protein